MWRFKSIYKTHEDKERMLEIYNRNMGKWPVPFESIYVKTRYGSTHTIKSGSKDAPPLILLNGLGATASFWLNNISALSRYYCCYAVDLIGDLGKSELNDLKNYPKNGRACSDWLRDVINELKIDKAHLIGFSHGGWIATNHAIYSPEQIRKLVLIAPSSLISNFGVLLFIISFLLFPTPSRGEKLLRKSLGIKVDKNDDFLSLMKLATQTMPKVAIPKVISNTQLRRITTPIKFILGEKDKPIHLKTMIKKIQSCIPNAQIAIAINSGHAMIIEASQFLDEEILKFLQE